MKSSRKQIFYGDLIFSVLTDVYEPADDTFLIADILSQIVRKGDFALDIGTGCGILAIIASMKARRVIATDVNPHAVECAKINAENNKTTGTIIIRLGDLFQPLRKDEKFDVIVFNAPYLPTSQLEQGTWIGRSWSGGPTGRQLSDRFIQEVPSYLKKNGKILLVQSSLANIARTLKKFSQAGLEAEIVAEKKVSFETIVVIQASHLFGRHVRS
jgi:release factor glutamine methyltransferase